MQTLCVLAQWPRPGFTRHCYTDMDVKKKTFTVWKNFRAGVEGNIFELKRAYGAGNAMWKYMGGYNALVWSSTLCYNLIRMVRFSST
jgi:IS5 family transposase